jgi:hypothetical protein
MSGLKEAADATGNIMRESCISSTSTTIFQRKRQVKKRELKNNLERFP